MGPDDWAEVQDDASAYAQPSPLPAAPERPGVASPGQARAGGQAAATLSAYAGLSGSFTKGLDGGRAAY